MSAEGERLGSGRSGDDGGDGRLARLAAELGLALPSFEGPLHAFAIGGELGPDGPFFLGGDLHATHPEARGRGTSSRRDPSLDSATIILTDYENETLQVSAVEGVWCLALPEDHVDPAPYFSLTDSEGRIRTWLLLPPPFLMLGIAHLWLPSVPPPTDPAGPAPIY